MRFAWRRVNGSGDQFEESPRPNWNSMKLRDLFSDDAAIDAPAGALTVSGLAMDSRAAKPGDVFFALAGSKTDGARFIEQAIASRAIAVVADQVPDGERRVPFVVVPN